jgi:hypothetical protein
MSENEITLLYVTLSNLSIVALSAFCCWYFNTLWGLLPLLWFNYGAYSKSESCDNVNKENVDTEI